MRWGDPSFQVFLKGQENHGLFLPNLALFFMAPLIISMIIIFHLLMIFGIPWSWPALWRCPPPPCMWRCSTWRSSGWSCAEPCGTCWESWHTATSRRESGFFLFLVPPSVWGTWSPCRTWSSAGPSPAPSSCWSCSVWRWCCLSVTSPGYWGWRWGGCSCWWTGWRASSPLPVGWDKGSSCWEKKGEKLSFSWEEETKMEQGSTWSPGLNSINDIFSACLDVPAYSIPCLAPYTNYSLYVTRAMPLYGNTRAKLLYMRIPEQCQCYHT